jgi:hypothetical protein
MKEIISLDDLQIGDFCELTFKFKHEGIEEFLVKRNIVCINKNYSNKYILFYSAYYGYNTIESVFFFCNPECKLFKSDQEFDLSSYVSLVKNDNPDKELISFFKSALNWLVFRSEK